MTLKDKISNKNIIFFSVQTFNLEKEIFNKLKEFGANVDYYDERPANNNFTKGIIRLKKSFYQHKIDIYYKSILKKTINKSYHFLFLNKGEVIPAFFLEEFKNLHPLCKLVFYTWDSFANNSHPINILKYFDCKATFDLEDANKYNIGFRPLFYLDAFKAIKNYSAEIKYDLIFLGTAHSDRYKLNKRIVYWCESNNLSAYFYYYVQGKFVFFFKKLFDKTFEEFEYKKMSFESLSTNQIVNLYKKSNVILDINHPNQKGLTLRTFEALGAQKKLITTNQEIKKYSFYNPRNILVIDRQNLTIDKKFFYSKYEPISDPIYQNASIDGWLADIFIEEKSNLWCK